MVADGLNSLSPRKNKTKDPKLPVALKKVACDGCEGRRVRRPGPAGKSSLKVTCKKPPHTAISFEGHLAPFCSSEAALRSTEN